MNIWSYFNSGLITGSDCKIPAMHFTVCKAHLKKKISQWKSEFSYYRDVQYKLFLLQSEHVLVVKKKTI